MTSRSIARGGWPLSPLTLSAAFAALASCTAAPTRISNYATDLRPYTDSIPGTLVTFEMVPVPGGTSVGAGPALEEEVVQVEPFYLSRTEVTWDMFDVFLLGLADETLIGDADAVARPSLPSYHEPDYGWGRGLRPANSVSRASAEAFTEWLSAITGIEYRLPTEAEWMHAAELAIAADPAPRPATLGWHSGNAGSQTHPVAFLPADALGLHDLFGNVAEWVLSDGADRVVRGGSFKDPADSIGPHSRSMQGPSWTIRDPQLPQSRWWLTDAPFVGFRLARSP